MLVFVLSYSILFCYLLLLSLRSLLVSKETRKGVNPGRREGGEWEEEREENCNQDTLCEKNIFSIKQKKNLHRGHAV